MTDDRFQKKTHQKDFKTSDIILIATKMPFDYGCGLHVDNSTHV